MEPLRPHERLGEIALESQGNPSVTGMKLKLWEAAAKMGANAAVLVADRTMHMGAIMTGPWYGRQISPEFQRFIVAVVIRDSSNEANKFYVTEVSPKRRI